MNKEFPKNESVDLQNTEKEKSFDVLKNNYQHYLELGGVVSEEDYQNIIDDMRTFDRNNSELRSRMAQVERMANYAKIKLSNPEDILDPRIVLYAVLRGNARLSKSEYHRIQTDLQVFREALRILGDADALGKLKESYHSNRPSGTSCPLCGQISDNENCL